VNDVQCINRWTSCIRKVNGGFLGKSILMLGKCFFLLWSNYSHNYLSLQSLNKHSRPKWRPKMNKVTIDHYSVTRQIRKKRIKSIWKLRHFLVTMLRKSYICKVFSIESKTYIILWISFYNSISAFLVVNFTLIWNFFWTFVHFVVSFEQILSIT